MGFGDMNFRLDFDTERIMAKIEASRRMADFALGNQVLKDSNIYCKVDTALSELAKKHPEIFDRNSKWR